MLSVRAGFLVALLGLTAIPAKAALYNFSYRFSEGRTVRGVLDGVVQADPNLVAVNAVVGLPTLDDLVFPGADVVTSFRSYAFEQNFTQAYASFDGTYVDLLVTNAAIDQGFGFAYDSDNFENFTQLILGGYFSFEELDPSNWSLSAAVPEPASWALLITGFGFVGTALRRQNRAAAA